MVIASKITLRRNFEEFLFPSTITYEDSKLIADEVKKIFKSNKKLKIFDFNNAHSIEMLYAFNAVNYVSDSFTNNDLEKLLLASKDFTTTIMVNEDDHIRIDARSYDDKILLLYDEVKKLEDKIDKKFKFAFDSRYGYLTTDLAHVGTGMIPSFVLHIPMLELSNQMPKVKEACNKFGYDIKPVFSYDEKSNGGFYEIYTKLTLGISEKEILSNLKLMILKLCDKEKSLRSEIVKKERLRLTDEVHRAYGIITHAKLISLKEAEVLISYIKLGLDLDLFDNDIKMKLKDFNVYDLLNIINDKSIQAQVPSDDKIEMDEARAEVIKEELGLVDIDFDDIDGDDIDDDDINDIKKLLGLD